MKIFGEINVIYVKNSYYSFELISDVTKNLTNSHLVLLLIILKRIGNNGSTWATNARLAEDMNMSRETIKKLLFGLKKYGYIKVYKKDNIRHISMGEKLRKRELEGGSNTTRGWVSDGLKEGYPVTHIELVPLNLFKKPLTPLNPPKGKRAKKKITYQDYPDFQTFWAAYPRKDGKYQALCAFSKIDVPIDQLVEAVELHKRAVFSKREARYIPHAASWLNQRRWEDEITNVEAEMPQELQTKLAEIKAYRIKMGLEEPEEPEEPEAVYNIETHCPDCIYELDKNIHNFINEL